MLEVVESLPTSPPSKVLTPHEARIERGDPVGLVGDAAKSKRARIQRMLEGFRDEPIRLNIDRARLLTESMKGTEGQPMVLRWGKALAHILTHHPIHIEDEELLVGSAGSPGRYAVVYCELVGPGRFYTHPHELVPSKPGDPIVITEQDVAALKGDILPYWERNAYHTATMNALPEETRRLMERIFVVTPTAAGRSMLAWAHDYGKVLERGIGSIRREALERLEALDPFDTQAYVEQQPFLEAIRLVCDAMIAFAHRYAELARSMAADEPREERRRELLEIPYFISTTRLEIKQSFDRKPEVLKVGEAFTRTITVTVGDALSMVIPPIPTVSVQGLAVYVDPPTVEDHGGERGERIGGTRVERATYIAEAEGDYRLPSVELAWWDVAEERLKTATLAAIELRVEADPTQVAAIPLPPEDLIKEPSDAASKSRIPIVELLRRWGIPVAAGALIFVLLARLWRRYGPVIRRQRADARRRYQDSEAARFAQLRTAIRSGDPRAIWSRWTSWLDRAHRGPGVATIRAFVEESHDPELARDYRALEAALFTKGRGTDPDWSPRDLYKSVAGARRQLARPRRKAALAASLNPAGQ